MTDTYELPEPFGFIEPTGRSPAFHYLRRPDEAGMPVYTADQVRAAVKAERERCAKLAEDMPITYERDGHYYNTVPEDYAAAIRKG